MINLSQRQKQDGRHTPDLWPVWLVAPGALLLVALAAYGLYHGTELLLASESTGKGKKPVSVQDVVKTTVTVLTLIGAVLAALYAYRKQLLDEGTSHRADATQLTERYTKAAEQLGHEQAAVRLAGVYAMARLADDWPEQRQVCVDVLCAYLRMPYETEPSEAAFRHGEREVRLTVIRIIRSHLQDPAEATTWCGRNLDFTGATFDGGDFSGSTFSGAEVLFGDAIFSGRVSFTGSTFSEGQVDFRGSTFSGGQVSFSDSTFSGGHVDFRGSTFSGSQVYFSGSTFSGGQVSFGGSTFSGGQVYFGTSTFSSGRIVFLNSTFSGSRVYFGGSSFSGGQVNLGLSTFSGGEVDFGLSTFSGGQVYFKRLAFSDGELSFRSSTFSGSRVDFGSSSFSGGRIVFLDATLSGGQVSFSGSRVGAAANIDWGPLPPVPANQP